ncbi:MAG: hypothetical protein DRI90_28490, partial [Deltaproteobacteria bacterium]
MRQLRKGLALGCLLLAACDGGAGSARPVSSVASTATTVGTAAVPEADLPAVPKLSWLERRLRDGDPRWAGWLDQAEELRLQILVTVVAPGKPWSTHEFRVDAEYFYPASAIKTFLAVGALRIMNDLAGEGADREIHRRTLIRRCRRDKSDCWPPRQDEEEDEQGAEVKSAEGEDQKKKHRKLRVGSEIHKMLSYSDNDSYNRLWDIVGHQGINEEMTRLGFSAVRLNHRMNAPADKSRRTARVLLLPPGKRAIVVPRRSSDFEVSATPARKLSIGKGHNAGGKIVDEPLDCSRMNHVSLRDLQRLNRALIFPDQPGAVTLGLTDDQRAYVIKAMTRRLESQK